MLQPCFPHRPSSDLRALTRLAAFGGVWQRVRADRGTESWGSGSSEKLALSFGLLGYITGLHAKWCLLLAQH